MTMLDEAEVERLLVAAFDDARATVVEHPDLFARVERSIEARSDSSLIDRLFFECSEARARHSGTRRPSPRSSWASCRSRQAMTCVIQKKLWPSRSKFGMRGSYAGLCAFASNLEGAQMVQGGNILTKGRNIGLRMLVLTSKSQT